MFIWRAFKKALAWKLDRKRRCLTGKRMRTQWNDQVEHCFVKCPLFSWSANFLEPWWAWSQASLIEPDDKTSIWILDIFHLTLHSQGPIWKLWIFLVYLNDFLLFFSCQIAYGRFFFLIDTHIKNFKELEFNALFESYVLCSFYN